MGSGRKVWLLGLALAICIVTLLLYKFTATPRIVTNIMNVVAVGLLVVFWVLRGRNRE